ncbi:MAG: histidine phosphatase family protein [Pseudomonadota bacterium]
MGLYPRQLLTGPDRVLLMRHGQPAGGQRSRFLGRGDPPLDELGQAQAVWWREELAGLGISRIVASDLGRTQATAAIIAQGQDRTVEPEPALREIDLGQWEGLDRAEVAQLWPREYAARGADPAGFRPPGGESFADLAARTWPALMALAAGPGPVLAVTHAGVLRVVLRQVLDLPWPALFRLHPDLAGLTVLSFKGDSPRLLALNLPPLMAG